MLFRNIKNCQISGSKKLVSILNLGYLPAVNNLNKIGSNSPEQKKYLAELLYCKKSSLVQLRTILDKKIIFPKSYPYTSSTTKSLSKNFENLFYEIKKKFNFRKNELIIDIGSNDGNLLDKFKNYFRVLGITPELIGKIAIKRGIPTIISYFEKKTVNIILNKYGKASVITATNVFAHIDKIHTVITQIKRLMKKKSIFINESHYLMPLIKNVQYDTVYHEHMRYYSLKSLKYLFSKHNLEIIDAKKIPTHGGSIRVYAAFNGSYKVNNSVKKILREEEKYINEKKFKDFRKNVFLSKIKLYSLINKIYKEKNIAGISAPSRASTLVNFVGLSDEIVDCIFEIKGSKKIGNFLPGTRIPIVEEKINELKKYDYLIIFSWHIYKEIITNLKRKGYKGKFILPLPNPKII